MSIKKIAEMTGASASTVSRVLNNPNYRCSRPGLREKIWKAAMELHYTPNEAARNLKKGTGRQNQNNYYIDILITEMDGVRMDPFYEELLHAVESQIHENACILSRVWYKSLLSDDRKCTPGKLEEIFQEMFGHAQEQQDGLVIIGKCNANAIKYMKKHYGNMVSVNRNSTNPGIDEVLCDGRKIAAQALSHLVGLGHMKIAYVGKCRDEERYQSYLDILMKKDLTFYPEYVIDTDQAEKSGFQAMERFMKMEDPPTGIYCANDITAIGILKFLEQFKSRTYMPSVIANDGIEAGELIRPMLSTVRLPKEHMAKFALFLLLDRIKKGHRDVVRVELEGKLMPRESCSPAAESRIIEYYI